MWHLNRACVCDVNKLECVLDIVGWVESVIHIIKMNKVTALNNVCNVYWIANQLDLHKNYGV